MYPKPNEKFVATTAPLPIGKIEIVEDERPLSPRTKRLIIAIRRALLIVADELGVMAGLDPRPK